MKASATTQWLLTGIPADLTLSRGDEDELPSYFLDRNRAELQRIVLLLGGCNLLFWPTDRWVFKELPQVIPVFNEGRLALTAIALGTWLLARWAPRSLQVLALVAGMLVCWVTARGFGALGGAGDGWFTFLLPLVCLPLLGWLPPLLRLIVTGAYAATIAWTYFLAIPGRLDEAMAPTSLLFLGFMTGLSVAIGWHLDDQRLRLVVAQRELARERDLLEERVRAKTQELRRLVSHLDRVEDGLRTHLARELHDELGQLLTAQRLVLKTTLRRHSQAPEAIGPNLTQLSDLVDQITTSVRGILVDLRPRTLEESGLPASLRWLTERSAESGGLTASVDLPEPFPPLDKEREVALYRCVQEALTNVVKHASATRCGIEVRVTATGLEVGIWDDGRGLDAARPSDVPSTGMGLVGIRERMLAFGGRVELGPRPGGGTRVQLWLPLESPPAPTAQEADP